MRIKIPYKKRVPYKNRVVITYFYKRYFEVIELFSNSNFLLLRSHLLWYLLELQGIILKLVIWLMKILRKDNSIKTNFVIITSIIQFYLGNTKKSTFFLSTNSLIAVPLDTNSMLNLMLLCTKEQVPKN